MILALTPYKVISHDLWCLRARWFCLFSLERVAVMQDGPGHPRILGGNRHGRTPVTPSLHEVADPATERVLLIAQVGHDRSSSKHQ